MSVDEQLSILRAEIEKLETKYCRNCQEWDCDMCPYEMEVQE